MFALMFALAAGTPMMQLKGGLRRGHLSRAQHELLILPSAVIIPCPTHFHDVATLFFFSILEVYAPFYLKFDLLHHAA